MKAAIGKLTDSWKWVALLLCIFGFFRELRPSEPFAAEFFITWRNVSTEDVTRILYPIGTYSYLAQLVIVFLITDMLRYKSVIIFSAAIGIALFSFMLWTETLYGLMMAQFCFGSFMAAEVAYYTYIYAKVDRSKYQLVTSYTRSAILAGRFLGSVIAQLFVSYSLMNYRQLNYLSLGSQCISLGWAILLPSVSVSMYFYTSNVVAPIEPSIGITDGNAEMTSYGGVEQRHHHQPQPQSNADGLAAQPIENQPQINSIESGHKEKSTTIEQKVSPKFSWRNAIYVLWTHFRTSYSNNVVVVWSIWWALAMAGFLQVQSYSQLLWKEIYTNETELYNGAVEAAITLLGAIAAFAAGFFDSGKFKRYDMLILSICSAIEGGLLICAARTNSLAVCYAMYILFGMVYHFMITIASATVAKKLHEDSFALIFGINTLVALILQSSLTYIAITSLDLNVRVQYHVYSGWFFALATAYSAIYIVTAIKQK